MRWLIYLLFLLSYLLVLTNAGFISWVQETYERGYKQLEKEGKINVKVKIQEEEYDTTVGSEGSPPDSQFPYSLFSQLVNKSLQLENKLKDVSSEEDSVGSFIPKEARLQIEEKMIYTNSESNDGGENFKKVTESDNLEETIKLVGNIEENENPIEFSSQSSEFIEQTKLSNLSYDKQGGINGISNSKDHSIGKNEVRTLENENDTELVYLDPEIVNKITESVIENKVIDIVANELRIVSETTISTTDITDNDAIAANYNFRDEQLDTSDHENSLNDEKKLSSDNDFTEQPVNEPSEHLSASEGAHSYLNEHAETQDSVPLIINESQSKQSKAQNDAAQFSNENYTQHSDDVSSSTEYDTDVTEHLDGMPSLNDPNSEIAEHSNGFSSSNEHDTDISEHSTGFSSSNEHNVEVAQHLNGFSSSNDNITEHSTGFSSSNDEVVEQLNGFSSSNDRNLEFAEHSNGFSSSNENITEHSTGFSSSNDEAVEQLNGFSSSNDHNLKIAEHSNGFSFSNDEVAEQGSSQAFPSASDTEKDKHSLLNISDEESVEITPAQLSPAERKFLADASSLLAAPVTSLDMCQHQVVLSLQKRCRDLSEEELGKFAVRLLNCQSHFERRQIYACNDHMALADCTSLMDSSTWNAYLLLSNRAHAVCHLSKQQQANAHAQLTARTVLEAANNQLEAMDKLKLEHSSLLEETKTSLHTMEEQSLRLHTQNRRNLEHQTLTEATFFSLMLTFDKSKRKLLREMISLKTLATDIRGQLNRDGEEQRGVLEEQRRVLSHFEEVKSWRDALEETVNRLRVSQHQTVRDQHNMAETVRRLDESVRELRKHLTVIDVVMGDAPESALLQHLCLLVVIETLSVLAKNARWMQFFLAVVVTGNLTSQLVLATGVAIVPLLVSLCAVVVAGTIYDSSGATYGSSGTVQSSNSPARPTFEFGRSFSDEDSPSQPLYSLQTRRHLAPSSETVCSTPLNRSNRNLLNSDPVNRNQTNTEQVNSSNRQLLNSEPFNRHQTDTLLLNSNPLHVNSTNRQLLNSESFNRSIEHLYSHPVTAMPVIKQEPNISTNRVSFAVDNDIRSYDANRSLDKLDASNMSYGRLNSSRRSCIALCKTGLPCKNTSLVEQEYCTRHRV